MVCCAVYELGLTILKGKQGDQRNSGLYGDAKAAASVTAFSVLLGHELGAPGQQEKQAEQVGTGRTIRRSVIRCLRHKPFPLQVPGASPSSRSSCPDDGRPLRDHHDQPGGGLVPSLWVTPLTLLPHCLGAVALSCSLLSEAD